MTSPIATSDDFHLEPGIAYMNAASISLMYRGAERAILDWTMQLSATGTRHFDEAVEEAVFDPLRRGAAELFNAAPEDIAVGSSATELLASLAWAVLPGPDTNLVGASIAFPSTVFPWARVASHTGADLRLAPATDHCTDHDALLGLIDDRTAIICVSEVEFAGGQRYDIARLADAAHAHDALLIVDATQSAGAVTIDVQASKADAVVSAGYKWLCGPFGAAVMYLAPQLHDRLEPGVVGFRSQHDMWDLEPGPLELAATARRFEPSTMAYGCAIGLGESIRHLVSVGIDRIDEHNAGLANRLIEGLLERGCEVVTPVRAPERASIVSARFPGRSAQTVADRLAEAGVIVSRRNDLVRWSVHLYNDEEDVDRVFAVLDTPGGCGCAAADGR